MTIADRSNKNRKPSLISEGSTRGGDLTKKPSYTLTSETMKVKARKEFEL